MLLRELKKNIQCKLKVILIATHLLSHLFLTINSTDTPWWEARHIQTGRQGFVPSNYVVIDDDRPEHQE